jgi:biotin carboxylase
MVVVYGLESMSPAEIAEGAQNLCELIWVFDSTDPSVSPFIPLIRRLGTNIDTNGLSDEEVAERIASDHPDGIITFTDLMPLASAIAEASNLRFHRSPTAEFLTNKYSQRLALARAGVPGPKFWPISAGDDPGAMAHMDGLHFPVIIKPQVGSGSRSTFRVADADTLERLFHEAQCEGEAMLIEELLAEAHPRDAQRFGDVLMVDSVVCEGAMAHYAVSGHFIPAPPFRGAGSFLPSHLTDGETENVLAAAEASAKALGIENGFINTDIILTPDGPRILEVNGRIGGQIPKLLEMAGHAPLLPEAMRFALRESDGDVAPVDTGQVVFNMYYQAPMDATRLAQLSGLDVVAQLPGVTEVVRERKVGDLIDWRRGTSSRLLKVYGMAEDHDHLYDLYQQIQHSVVARYETS